MAHPSHPENSFYRTGRESVLRFRIVAMLIATVLFADIASQAQTFTVLYSFYSFSDGGSPQGILLRDDAGNLYGITDFGGARNESGTVFKLSPDGVKTVLHAFAGGAGGAWPEGGLAADSFGNVYGTVVQGGSTSCGLSDGCGLVYKLDYPTGSFSILHTFAGQPLDGASSVGSVIVDSAGNVYGTTSGGGTFNSGTVFKLDPAGNETILHSFAGSPDGRMPYAGLVRDAAGNLYGTTTAGGEKDWGTIFKITPDGNLTLLHSFLGPDGLGPEANLSVAPNGDLYGTTFNGGSLHCHHGCGTVFRLSTTGKLKVLYRFLGSPDGAFPLKSTLVWDSAHNLYGTTPVGGSHNHGTIFKIDKNDQLTILYSFTGKADGATPIGGLLRDGSGVLYGTTRDGGLRYGVVYKFIP